MAFTQSDVDKIKSGLVGGVRRIRFEDGRETEYRSVAEMKEALRLAQSEVDAGARKPRGHTVAGF